MNGLALLQFLTACVVSDALPEAAWQFANMIVCAQPKVNPLDFNNYGCYCGLGGSGEPVDDVDRCCQTHDNCYGDVEKEGCTSFFQPNVLAVYDYTCTNKEVECPDSNNKCQATLCECDRAASNCFNRSVYIPAHKNLDQKLCKKNVPLQNLGQNSTVF